MAHERTYLLGLDAGNTVIKTVLFDLAGRQVAHHAVDGRSTHPEPGQVERDLGELWRNACTAIRAVIEQAGISPGQIAAIGCAGHGNGLYLLDRSNNPLLGIQSLDNRAAALSRQIDIEAGKELQMRCLQRPWPAQTPSLLAWVRAHRPEIYRQAGRLLFCKDYVNFCLTGQLVSDVSDLSGAGLLDMQTGRPEPTLMALYGLEDTCALIGEVADPCDIVGRVTPDAAGQTGLAVGTPVIAGFFDVVSSAMGSGVCRPGEASIIAGTWSINQVFADRPLIDEALFMVATFGKGRYVNIESSATSAANLEWYMQCFPGSHDPAAYERINALVAAVAPRRDDPIFHPYIFGSRRRAACRGGFYGLGGWHGEGHLLRALFEGVAFEHRRHVDVLGRTGLAIDTAVLSGGGSRSIAWSQIMADVLGLPIEVAEARETGALGAAIGAGVAAGLFADVEAGVAAMTRKSRRHEPDPGLRTHFDQRYHLFLDLADRMESFWDELAGI